MSSRERTIHPSAQILLEALDSGRLTRVDVMRSLGLASRQNVTNWLSHGVPARHIPGVARLCGMSTDEYRARCGLEGAETDVMILPANEQIQKLIANFEALPPALQSYFLRKMKEAKKFADSLPAFLLDGVPDDSEKLRAWERGFFAAMDKQANSGELPVEPPQRAAEEKA